MKVWDAVPSGRELVCIIWKEMRLGLVVYQTCYGMTTFATC
jgi:hypothetical protein